MKLHAARRPHADPSAETIEWTARADVPDGWDLLHVRTED